MPMLLPASEPSPLVKISSRGEKTPMQVSHTEAKAEYAAMGR